MGNDEASRILAETAHRPWPLPRDPWLIWQEWEHVGFANWRLPPDRLRAHVPSALELDTFDGDAWLTLTPLRVRLRPRGPRLPISSLDFVELNLRTYVRAGGSAGVFFFSLDAASRRAVALARAFYRLPYFSAGMRMDDEGGRIRFESRRLSGRAELSAGYAATGEASEPAAGSLEAWLTERYALFVVLRRGTVHRTDVHHRPWLLHPGSLEIEENSVASAAGLDVQGDPDVVLYARRQPVLTWGPRSVPLP